MVITPYCNKHKMAIRLLTSSHCVQRDSKECMPDKCGYYKIKMSCPVMR